MRMAILAILVAIVLFILLQPTGEKIIVYGSMDCPWTVKQLNNLNGRAEFFDCKTNKCPDFVKGYPTVVKEGQVYNGFQENI